jgi:orotate phosphoribosyltransferase
MDLAKLIKKLSYREGDFTLVSGKKSNFYIDLKNTTLHPEGAQLIGNQSIDLIQSRKISIDAVGGMTLGADPIATAVSLAAFNRKIVWPAFIVRKEPKKHGTSQFIEGTDNLKPGARVLIVEDVVTTGGSSVKAIEIVKAAGFKPVAVLTVVDREEGGEKVFRALGLEFLALTRISEIRGA